MNSWKKGDLLKSKEYKQYVTFIAFNPNNVELPELFIGTDSDGVTYEDWIVDKFEKVEVNNETH